MMSVREMGRDDGQMGRSGGEGVGKEVRRERKSVGERWEGCGRKIG